NTGCVSKGKGMPPDLAHQRRFRLIALGGDALAGVRPSELLPPLERLLHAGVLVVVASEGEREARELARAVRGPHARNLVVRDVEEAGPVELGAGAAKRPLARWMRDALVLPRGIRPADVLLLGPPRALATGLDASVCVEPLDGSVAARLAAHAACHPVELPGWIENGPEWQLVEEGYVGLREHELESLFALGNGYIGTRASLAEGSPLSSPATFVAGIFDRPEGHEGDVPELLKLPDWARLAGSIEGDALRID